MGNFIIISGAVSAMLALAAIAAGTIYAALLLVI